MNCGECPVSLMCYTGKLKSMRLCPLCNTLRLCIGAQIKLIHCCKRQCDMNIKKGWFLRYDVQYVMLGDSYYDLYTTLIVGDPGPMQTKYVYELRGYLLVDLCDYCRSQLMNENKEQRYSKIRHILSI